MLRRWHHHLSPWSPRGNLSGCLDFTCSHGASPSCGSGCGGHHHLRNKDCQWLVRWTTQNEHPWLPIVATASRPAWPCAAPCPSHCIGSPSEALGRRPYNLYAIRRRWKKVWVSTDPLPQKPARPISIYSPNPTSIYLYFWRKWSRSTYHKIIQLVSQHAQRTFTQIKYTVYPPGN